MSTDQQQPDHPAPVPQRITWALNARRLYGPEVDRALGGEEPMVDEWEAGIRVPTPDQIKALADLTGFPVSFFYRPVPREIGHGFICVRSGRGRGCKAVTFGDAAVRPPEGEQTTLW